MMLKKPSLFIALFMICMTFLGLTQAIVLNKRQIAYCDFDPPPGDIVNGRFTWQELSNKETQVVGMFTSGFEDPDIKNYKFILKDSNGKTKYDLTKSISSKIQIIKPGTSPYEECFENDFMNPDDVIGLTFIVKCQDKEIGKALIKSG